ncbi:SDR family NAD(P)-dependent oxidoreductase [Streptomyces albidoflavus]|uniref:SDR family NAD(P)-dependent oxidoreductase n=2 Tax=Streptomyces TaxID=1883 RepID=UPI0022599B56|nr:SDR family NAD(P)-dependent oxidoreductase [Streptomyces albidoflavus]MCX4444518.1 SDR family NAD(P)-dependent oxidoreductase [Streptomyces albidoflavus]
MTPRAETYEKAFAGREPLIAQHRAEGAGLLPAAVQIEMALAGIARRRPFVPLELTDVAFLRPLALTPEETVPVRLDVTHEDAPGEGARFELSAVLAGERKQLSTGTGRLLRDGETAPRHAARPAADGRPLTPQELYEGWSRAGLDYGPDFRTVRELTVGDGTARARLRTDTEPLPWHAHPLLVDGVLQVVSCALQELGADTTPVPMLPIGIARVAVLADLSARATGVTVLVRRTGVEGAYATGDAVVLGPSGETAAEFTGVRMRRTTGPGAVRTAPAATGHPLSRIEWRPAAAPPAPRPDTTGTWVVLRHGDDDRLADETGRLLRTGGARVVDAYLEAPAGREDSGHDHHVLADTGEAAFRGLWEAVGEEVAGVVHLGNSGPVRAEAGELATGPYGCAAALKTLGERQRRARFLVVTHAAQPVAGGDRPVPARAALWGLMRTAAVEYPGLQPRLLDLDEESEPALPAELGDGPPETGYRHGVRHEPVRVSTRPGATGTPPVRRGGHYLILGGHGGLGLALAERLAHEGAAVVALASRSGGASTGHPPSQQIEGTACSLRSYAVDVTAPGALTDLVGRIRADVGELHGVVHAAGTLKDGLLRSATAEDLAAVMRPKVDGVRELAAAVAGSELDFAVLFASVSGAFGNLGQGGYAAANAYLDGFAHAHGAPWTSIDWGLWGETGMGTAVAAQLRRRGVRPLGTTEALDALLAVLGDPPRQVVIAHPDASDTLADEEPPPAPVRAPAGKAPTPHAQRARVEDELARFLTDRLGLASFDRATPLADHGMSSIMSVELAEELSRRWDVHLPATLFLEYGGLTELAEALTERYGVAAALPAPPPPAPPAPAPQPPAATTAARTTRPEDIAVVAVSADLPGATSLEGFWHLLRSGRHAFTEVPAERWDVAAHFEPRGPQMTGTYCRSGAFLSDIDRFDPAFFSISVREAEEMDAQQKLLLEHAWAVRDESGLAGHRDIGVFVGATYTHHRDAHGLDEVGPHTALGSMNAVLANRISYALDLTGPSQTVDTLCSSGLVAVQQAVAALRAGQCGAALVAACHVGLTPWYYRSLSQLGALSESRPRPFDDRADGFLPGEGAVAVMLKPLAAAERDGDTVWGVIRGAAVNHGGRGSALPVPRSEAQSAVVRAALADAELDASDITLIETHGTATRLGDPIEIAALTEVFGAGPERREPCLLGSAKANIGHLEPASGLAGLVKILLCLRHREVPPLAGFERPGSHLDLDAGPFTVPTAPLPWPGGDRPRRAGLSAFGMGGTNAHVVVEEHVPGESVPEGPPDVLGEHLLVLSGHTPEALVRRARDLLRLLSEEDAPDTAALCRSAAVGRDHQRHRAAVLGSGPEQLRAGLDRIARHHGDAHGTVLRDGRVVATDLGPATGTADTAPYARLAAYTTVGADRLRAQLALPDDRLSTALACFHVSGGSVDWRQVHAGTRARRIVLPPYPFRPPSGDQPAASRPDPDDSVRRLTRAHRVFGEPTVPAALPLARALDHAEVLEHVTFTARGTGDGPLTGDLDDPGRPGPAAFRHGERVIARLTTANRTQDPVPAAPDLAQLRAGLDRGLEPEGLYAWFAAQGMEIEAPLRSLAGLRYGATRVLARLDTPAEGGPERAAVALDAALQSMAVLTLADPAVPRGTYLPVSVARVVRWDDPARTAYVLLDAEHTGADPVRRGEATLLARDGRVLARLSGIEYRPVAGPGAPEPEATAPRPQAEPSATPPGAEHLAAAEAAVLAAVRGVFHDPGITATTPLSGAGLDSLLATAVAADLESAHGLRVSLADVLDAPDCRTLAQYLAERAAEGTFTPAQEAGPAAASRPEPPHTEHPDAVPAPADDEARDGDLAIIGFAFALPGAQDEAALWSLLADGGTAVRPAPAHRWGAYADRRHTDVGGFLDNAEEFDARFFDFFPKQAEVLDPQARWLLRTTWEALESAGLPPRQLAPATGVFVGASYQHYREYNIAPELDAHSGLGNHNAFLANRLSYFLDLRGPSMTVDTLCSSSLVALHQAVRSIRSGECEQAVVAGVRVGMSPLHYVAMRELRALSPSGVVRAFDAGADGFVPGEGVVSVVVKSLGAALRDGDRVRGVVRGSAVGHGGRTSGLTVPSGGGQGEVVVAALVDAGVSPDSLGVVEAHGTGTGLGDPIEVEGLSRAWRRFTGRSQFCALGSVKSNIGHLEPAAGLAGLVKVLLAMEHGVVPGSLHVRRPNDHIRFEDSPFFLVDRPWVWGREEGPRRGAVSAFGMGGVNAHVIVEEPPPVERGAVPVQDSHLVRVTGADERAVRELAAAYADRFATSRGPWDTVDLCHTANVGRSPQEYVTAVHGRDAAELAENLRAVAAGRLPVGVAGSGTRAPDPAPTGHAALAELVRTGYTGVDWPALSVPGARTTDLPTYPFAPGRHWHMHTEVTAPAEGAPPEAYRATWREEALPQEAQAAPGTVRLVVTDPALHEALTAELRLYGAHVAGTEAEADTVLMVDATPPGREPDLSTFWARVAEMLKALPPHGRLLWAACHGAAVRPGEHASLRPGTAAQAMAVAAACAESRIAHAVVHLDPSEPAEARARVLAAEYAALRQGGESTAAAHRAGVRYVPDTSPVRPGRAYEVRPDGYYLVTGGLGAIGRRLVERLIDRGARHIGIVGRSALDPGRSQTLRALATRAEVVYRSCDVADAPALTAVVGELDARWGRLRGIVHCSGGVNAFGAMRRRPWADAARVVTPKTDGSLHAVRLAQDRGADFAVLTSSLAGTHADAGRGLVDYSLANAYQLALAEREHGPATAVTAHAWPNWTGVGMAADAAFAAAHSLDATEAEAAFFGHLLTGGAVVLPGHAPAAPPASPADTPETREPGPGTRTVIPAPATGRDRTALRAHVRDAFLHVLGDDPGDRPLRGLGLDSLVIAELATALEQRAGRTVDPSLLMRARTADELAAELAATAAGPPEAGAGPAVPADATGATGLSLLLRPLLTDGGDGVTP